MKKNNKVVKYRKNRQIDFMKIIFLLVVIYVVFLGISYARKEHISIYEVNETKIADDTTLKGFILRAEKVYKTNRAGYVNYFNPEGNKIAVGDVVYTVDSTGNVANTLATMDNKSELTDEEIASVRQVIAKYQDNFNPAYYSQVYDYQYEVRNTAFDQTKKDLYSDLESVLARNGQSDTFHKVTAKRSGVISYSVDGFEDLKVNDITMDTFNQEVSMKKQQLRTTSSVPENSPVYKLVTSENWGLVVPLTEAYYQKIKDKSVIRVKVKKDNISFNANLTVLDKSDGKFAVLSMSRFMQRYINDRFLDIELNLNSAEGLKIPNSSIVQEERYVVPVSYSAITEGEPPTKIFRKEAIKKDGTETYKVVPYDNTIEVDQQYYVSKSLLTAGDVLLPSDGLTEKYTVGRQETIPGVYCVNEGYCKFVRIEKIYENSEYTIIKPDTQGGLAVFDHIVVNPKTLNENDFIQ